MLNKDKISKPKKPIPRTTSDSIPYENVYPNGIIEVMDQRFSKSYIIPDVNFKTATDDSQIKLAEQYSDFISSFGDDVDIEITLYNESVDIEKFKEQICIPMRDDDYNEYREEYNQMILDKMASAKNNLSTKKILTITINATDIFSATERFLQIDNLISDQITTMTKSAISPMTMLERMELLNSIYNQESSTPLYQKRVINGMTVESFSLENCEAQGITTKDVIAPPYMEFKSNYGVIGEKIVKSFYVANYPTWIKASIFTDFSAIPANILVSTFFRVQDQGESIKMIRRQGVNIASEILQKEKQASRAGYGIDLLSPELKASKEETDELLNKLTKDNGKLITTTFVFTLFADDEKQMAFLEKELKQIGTKNMITIKPLKGQQEDGFATSLPIGNKKIVIDRLMSSQTVASIIPFDVKDICQTNGKYCGLNASSQNLVIIDKSTGLNSCSAILGMPGSGKSFFSKEEIIDTLLTTDDYVYIIDPDGEYEPIANELGGAVVKIANSSKYHINPFDLNLKNITEENNDPVKVKCDFIETFSELMIGGKFGLNSIENSIIDRCVIQIYDPYVQYLNRTGKLQDTEHAPTLKDFYNNLLAQPQPDAINLALAFERYVKGGLDVFSHHTNIDISKRLVVYDTRSIGSGLKPLGQHLCIDNIWNKMIENKLNGKRTWVYIDEFHSLMKNPSSGSYIAEIWKRARKWDGYPCAITQNVEDMLNDSNARTVLNNSAYVLLLGQTPINRQQLSGIYSLSPDEQKYISTAKPGMGLICFNLTDIIPISNDFPKDTKLYKMMSTKPQETI